MKTKLTGFVARGFKNLSPGVGEELPPRLLLTGPNGSGKTARLEAIRYALAGPPGRDGFLPFMGGTECEVSVHAENGFSVLRGCDVRTRAGKVSVSNYATCSPSRGEKSAAEIAARVEEALSPDLFLLDLDGFLSRSPAERRRALLGLLPPTGAFSVKHAREALSRAVEEGAPEALPLMHKLLTGVDSGSPDPMTFLANMEAAAKATQTDAAARKKAAEGRLTTMREFTGMLPPEPLDALKEKLEALNAQIETATREAAEGRERARRIKALEEEIAKLRGMIPPEVFLTEGTPKNAMAGLIRARTTRRQEAGDNLQRRQADRVSAEAAAEEASKVAHTSLGRLGALQRLKETAKADTCPVCEATGFTPERLNLQIEKAMDAYRLDSQKENAAGTKVIEARREEAAAQKVVVALDDLLREDRAAEERVLRLEVAEADLAREKEGAEGRPASAEEINGLKARREDLQKQVEEVSRMEERRKLRADASREVEAAEEERKIAAALAHHAGPAGVAGTLLSECLHPILTELNRVWGAGRLSIRLKDERGDPDAMLSKVIQRPDGSEAAVNFSTMSGGEQARALAAFMAAVAKVRPHRTSVALVEAGEIDPERLAILCDTLRDSAVDNVMIATYLDPLPESETYRGFTVRRLGVVA